MNSTDEHIAAKRTIIVSGASGFIGQQFVKRLHENGVRIVTVSRQACPSSCPPENWIRLSGDKLHLPKADAIVNLAGKAHAMKEVSPDHEEYAFANSKLPVLLAQAGLDAGIKRFIQISTVKVWSDATVAQINQENRVVDVSVEPDADTIYGQTKLAGERLLGDLKDLELFVLRLSMVYGIGNKGNLPKLIAAAKMKFFPRLPKSCGMRSMVHVDDVIDAIFLALVAKPIGSTPLIITSNAPFSAATICDWVRQEIGLKPSFLCIPAFVLRAAGYMGSIAECIIRRRLPVNIEAMDRLLSPYIVDAKLAHDLLGFTAQKRLEDFVRNSVHNK